MGILDHRKTWRFVVKGGPQECVAAFADAFTQGGHIMKAKWDLRRSDSGTVAVYGGRAGLIKGITMLSSRATAEQDNAIGSEVTFEIEQVSGGSVTCAMWLSSRGTAMGFTADGRFFRPYMRAVEDHLRRIDPQITVSKG